MKRLIVVVSLSLAFLFSCDDNETKQPIRFEYIRKEILTNIKSVKLIINDLPYSFNCDNEAIKMFYQKSIKDLHRTLKNCNDNFAFYDKFSKVITHISKTIYNNESIVANINNPELFTELLYFLKDTYFRELESNGYDYIKTGIIIENSLIKSQMLDENTKIILHDFIYNISIFFDSISSELNKSGSKITEKAFLRCVDKELDDIFSNPVKTINFLIKPPISFLWLSAGCIYDTWNA